MLFEDLPVCGRTHFIHGEADHDQAGMLAHHATDQSIHDLQPACQPVRGLRGVDIATEQEQTIQAQFELSVDLESFCTVERSRP